MRIEWFKLPRISFTVEKVLEPIEPPVVEKQYWEFRNGTLYLGGSYWEGANEFDPYYEDITPPWYDYRLAVITVNIQSEFFPRTCYKYFDQMHSLTNIEGLENLNLTECVSMYHAFRECWVLKTPIAFSTAAPLNANLQSTFKDCRAVKSIDVSGICPSACMTLNSLFYNCWELREIRGLETFDTSSVTAFNSMFRELQVKEINGITNWDTRNGTVFNNIFTNSYRIQELDLSGWETPNATNFSQCFLGCYGLRTLDISKLTTSSSTNISRMFENCQTIFTIRGIPFTAWSLDSNCFWFCYNIPTWTGEVGANMAAVYFNQEEYKTVPPTNLRRENHWLEWDPVDDATSYNVYVFDSMTGTYSDPINTRGCFFEIEQSDLFTEQMPYKIQVKSQRGWIESDFSEPFTYTIRGQLFEAYNLSVDSNKVLHWGEMEGADLRTITVESYGEFITSVDFIGPVISGEYDLSEFLTEPVEYTITIVRYGWGKLPSGPSYLTVTGG